MTGALNADAPFVIGGAMINLLRVADRMRFEVAPAPAERSGLKISSRMLTLALHVKPARTSPTTRSASWRTR